MSRTERHVGRLRELSFDGSLESACKHIMKDNKIPIKDYYDSYREALEDGCIEEYIILNERIFKIIGDIEEDDVSDIFDMEYVGGGEYFYTVKFHTDEGGYTEALEYAFKKMEKNNEKL